MTLVYPQVVTGADLLRGIMKLEELVQRLRELQASAVAIVDSKMYNIRSFYQTMQQYQIFPIIGLSIWVEVNEEENILLYLYAKDNRGYQNLLKMSSAAALRTPETLPIHWLNAYSGGCIAIAPMTDRTWAASRSIDTLQCIQQAVQGILAVGVSRPGGVKHVEEEKIVSLANKLGCPIVACHEAKFLKKEDAFAYEVATAIREGYKLQDEQRPPFRDEYAYLPTMDEWKSWYKDQIGWIDTMHQLLLSCKASIPPSQKRLPRFPVPNNETAITFLEKKSKLGLRGRLGELVPTYLQRLDYELTVINRLGYADYFLIVADFIRFAKKAGILTGPGRGSSASSLVAYALGITEVDPIRYGLIFERFLNPERVTMPDIDVDFADHRRHEVIDYLVQKYGKQHVAQIITFGTLTAKAVARNVARVFHFTSEEMNFISRSIDRAKGHDLATIIQNSQPLQDWLEIAPVRRDWLQVALKLEGLPRNASTHAAGVVLSPTPLVETVPVQQGEGIFHTQWAMQDVEAQGLLKIDLLGLRNLTLLDRIVKMITYDKGKKIDLASIPLDDERTFQLFQKGETTGVFQFESAGMRQALRQIQPSQFEDLYAINALYRPGPMDYIPLYRKRKHGEEAVRMIHPDLEPILRETFGIIVYQEQIMQIAVQIAGFSLGEADLLRRAISKKNYEAFAKERQHFITSAVQRGYSEQVATAIYTFIEKFANYGFPKSHAVAYAMIAYRLAYLKANEPAYFYASLLAQSIGNEGKTIEILQEMNQQQIQILPPSIKNSRYLHTVEDGAVRIGLGAIKGVTPSFYQALQTARNESDNWRNLFDFAKGMGGEAFNEKTIRPLIYAGALDIFHESRAVLLASIEAARKYAVFLQSEEGDLLQDVIATSVAQPKYTPADPLPHLVRLENERSVLGFYLSEHPAVAYKKQFRLQLPTIQETLSYPKGKPVEIAGVLLDVKQIRTKRGEAMAFLTVQDETGELDCTCFPKQYRQWQDKLPPLSFIKIHGKVDIRNDKQQLIVNQITVYE